VQLAIRLPYHTDVVSGEVMTEVAVVAEQAGFHSGWVADHIVLPAGELRSRNAITAGGGYPRPFDEPTLESWTSLAYVAGATARLGLGVGVCVLPYRNPVLLAKVVASLDVLSGGRVLCGLGMGWIEEEFEALGVPFASRRARLDEGIALMRRCWEGSPVTFDGDHFAIREPVHFVPRPARRVPIIIGGNSLPALRRATNADGWIGHELTPEGCVEMRSRLEDAAGGLLAPDFLFVNSRLFNVPGAAAVEPGRMDINSTGQLSDLLARYQDAGVDILLCESTIRTGDALVRLVHEVHAAGGRLGLLRV
jgi:probable F420-dependent oxidoreductase